MGVDVEALPPARVVEYLGATSPGGTAVLVGAPRLGWPVPDG